MSFQIRKFTLRDEHALARMALTIRTEVFVNEQQVDPGLEYEHEEECTHYLLFAGGQAVATARWRETSEGIKLERFATLPDHRSKGYGTAILRVILADVIPLGRPVYLHAQLTAERFYLQHGFERVGELFSEANIEHYKMIYRTV